MMPSRVATEKGFLPLNSLFPQGSHDFLMSKTLHFHPALVLFDKIFSREAVSKWKSASLLQAVFCFLELWEDLRRIQII